METLGRLCREYRDTIDINSLYILMWLLNKPTIKRYHRRYLYNEQLITGETYREYEIKRFLGEGLRVRQPQGFKRTED